MLKPLCSLQNAAPHQAPVSTEGASSPGAAAAGAAGGGSPTDRKSMSRDILSELRFQEMSYEIKYTIVKFLTGFV